MDQPATFPATSAVLDAVALCDQTLSLHATRVRVPTYDRASLTPAVVHLSVGGFHRAHQLVYFDDLAEQGCSDWGVVGVGLHTVTMRDALAPQDHLFTVVERDGDGDRARVIGALVDYHFAPDSPEAVLARLTDDRTRLVTMTLTGTAYRIDPRTGELDPDEEMLADLADPHSPSSVFGYLVEALDRRRRAGQRPFTVLSCDNMEHNGRAARAAVVGLARLRDEVLARWIADSVSFPSSMVDRITPWTSTADRDDIARTFGVDDRWPVITEAFSQWIVEDDFCNGRPPLEDVGVGFVADVTRHQLMKTRLLNGSHSALGYLGHLAGLDRIDEVMDDEVLREYVTRLMAEEIAPLLPRPAGIDLAAYQQTLLERFANPAIGDRLERLCRRGSSKVPDHLLPSLRAALEQGRPFELLALAVAGWFRYLRGVDLAGRPIEVEDEHAERLTQLARAAGSDPRPLLAERSLFGDLADEPHLVEALASALQRLDRDGVRATLATALRARPAARRPAALAVDDDVPAAQEQLA
ncbi:MAG: mannitol dehydrogenase [Modestobacter sp.]|nr:mannitol dehydrogenase [Modestobacter sp.]